MSEELAFKIQLGVILPKMKEKIEEDISAIVKEVSNYVSAGCRFDEKVELAPIKEIIMKDFEILLEDLILPKLEKELKPKVSEDEKKDDETMDVNSTENDEVN
ncbi:MAG: hypothetical protein GY756_00940 [bacterium]|nr:hypothetical protein [bacterium]